MTDSVRIQVLMPVEEAERFEEYCRERGFKKSTLIVRLVRDHLECGSVTGKICVPECRSIGRCTRL